jgi:protein-S-isoprenylcysteine O-methyltransferase Ste14
MSCDVKVTEGHRLVKEGPYRYIRHPLILCVILEVIGFTLVSNSYFSTLGAILIFLPFMLYRIKLEERALIEKFGHEYIDYQHTTWMLLPIPWRRKR